MEDAAWEDGKREARLKDGRTVKEYAKAAAVDEETGPVFSERSAVVTDAPNIPEPPFWGVRVVKNYDLREIFNYINDTALFKNQWQLKTASQEDYARLVEEKYRPIKKKLEEDVLAAGWFEPKVVYGYFPAQGDGNDVVVYDPSECRESSRRDGRPREPVLSEAEGSKPSEARKQPGPSEPTGTSVSTQPKELLRFTFPRQNDARPPSLSHFFPSPSPLTLAVL